MYLTYKGLHYNVCGVTAVARVYGGRRNMWAGAVGGRSVVAGTCPQRGSRRPPQASGGAGPCGQRVFHRPGPPDDAA